MAHLCDPELVLDSDGDLMSLYKRGTKVLVSAEQVASCVKFRRLDVMVKDELPTAFALPYGEIQGLKVNLIGGPRGSGKTSLIHILAGGMETASKHQSDNKCLTVYILKVEQEGEDIAVLDTAGLCDTAANPDEDIGMQELLINAVAATVKRFNMTIVSLLMCCSLTGVWPPNFGDVWPQMQMGLGGEHLDALCKFVVTMANGDSRINRAKLAKLPESDFFKALQYSSLKWPVIAAGRENLEQIRDALLPMSTLASGVAAEAVQSDVESLA